MEGEKGNPLAVENNFFTILVMYSLSRADNQIFVETLHATSLHVEQTYRFKTKTALYLIPL